MAHVELNLNSPEACTGDYGAYEGVLYFLSGHGGIARQFELDDPQYKVSKPGVLVHKAREIVGNNIGTDIEPEQLIALAVSRICIPKLVEIDEKAKPPRHDRMRLERVASLAIASSIEDIEKIRPLNALERNFSAHGIGYARRISPGLAPIRPLVHLPVTSVEARKYSIVGAIRSYATSSAIAHQPYIVLHGSEHGIIEQIVTPDQL